MPFVPFNIGRLPYGAKVEPDRLRQMADFINAMIDVNGDFLLGDITIGRGGGRIYSNAAIGRNVLKMNTIGTNIFGAGNNALAANTTGGWHAAAGNNALGSNTTGNFNSAFGNGAAYANVTGDSISAFGSGSLGNCTAGGNSAFGSVSLGSLIGGGGNSAVGYASGFGITVGTNGVYVGWQAGAYLSDGTTVVTGADDGVYIGYNAHPGGVSTDNEIVIGSGAIGNGSNTTVIGTSSTAAAHIYGAVTVGGLVIDDAKNIVLNTTTGTKIGTATSQKLGLWNATPVVQPTTAVTAAAFTANSSGIADDTATFGGYTIGQIVAALKAIGALA